MTNNIYSIKKGEKFPIHFYVKFKEECKPIDLTGSIIKFQIKDELKDEIFVVEKTITTDTDISTVGQIINAENGEFVVRLTDDDYENLVVERVYYLVITWIVPDEDFVKVISSNGNEYLKFVVCIP